VLENNRLIGVYNHHRGSLRAFRQSHETSRRPSVNSHFLNPGGFSALRQIGGSVGKRKK
jgi:hypothetical protein